MPSGQTPLLGGVVVLTFFAEILANIGSVTVPIWQVLLETWQVKPLGQQCFISEQQVAFGYGQQPYAPDANLQHVVPAGHSEVPSAQTPFAAGWLTFTFLSDFLAVNLAYIGNLKTPIWQVPAETSQVYPFGQQCCLSEQQVALGKGQQA